MGARGPRKPPPDTVDNGRGRIYQLRTLAKQSAGADVRDGADKDRALAKRMRAIEPALKNLQRRLGHARKAEGAPAARTDKATAKKKSKTAKKTVASGGEDDLLSTLDSL